MIIKLNEHNLQREIARLGVHPASCGIFAAKSKILPLKLTQVRTPAANILKQEMLAAGGDCAVPGSCILNETKYVDAVLLGTVKHYRILARKLAQMPFFGLAQVREDLQKFLAAQQPVTLLADGRQLTYEKLRIMGILNVTPDSFYSGSRVGADVVARAEQMLADGADILDIGGESTRPGSDAVSVEEEISRVVPAVEAVKKALPQSIISVVPAVEAVKKALPQSIISVDTYHAATAQAAINAGADIINDVTALTGDEAMAQVAAAAKVPVVLMHMRGTPKTMQQNCEYDDVVTEVTAYLKQRAQALSGLGIGADKIILDPGIGFAKNTEQNLELLQGLDALTAFGYPVLLAASRKTVIGQMLGNLPPQERLEGTIALSCAAVYAGANMVRVHDVKENIRAVRMLEAVLCR